MRTSLLLFSALAMQSIAAPGSFFDFVERKPSQGPSTQATLPEYCENFSGTWSGECQYKFWDGRVQKYGWAGQITQDKCSSIQFRSGSSEWTYLIGSTSGGTHLYKAYFQIGVGQSWWSKDGKKVYTSGVNFAPDHNGHTNSSARNEVMELTDSNTLLSSRSLSDYGDWLEPHIDLGSCVLVRTTSK